MKNEEENERRKREESVQVLWSTQVGSDEKSKHGGSLEKKCYLLIL